MADLFQDSACRLCAHWAGTVQHVAEQAPALCRMRTRLDPHPRTYADDSCGQFKDAACRRAA